MADEVDVSIIVPSYQQGSFVKACLDSIIAQDGVSVEILVFDSESTDETPAVLEEYLSRAECVIEKDLGQANAINKGLRRCKGRIIGYLNSDDAIAPGALKHVLNCWKQDPSIDLLYGKAKYIDESGSIIGEYKTKQWDWGRFKGECFICQPAAFWSRRVMEHIGFMDESLECSVDYDYWMRIAQSGGKICFVDQCLAYSRDYPSTKTRALRGTVFIENFRISLSRIGVIHPFWIDQYLDYRKYELLSIWRVLIPSNSRLRSIATGILSMASRLMAKDVKFDSIRGKPVI